MLEKATRIRQHRKLWVGEYCPAATRQNPVTLPKRNSFFTTPSHMAFATSKAPKAEKVDKPDKAEKGVLPLDEQELALLRTLRNQAIIAFRQSV